MKKVAVVTDSNAGIRQKEAKELGIFVLPMPFTIDDQTYYEDINLTHEEFFEKQLNGAEIFTSQPVVGNVKELWDQILKDYDEIVHIPMSSGLSGSCQTAMMLAQEYDNRVFVVDSQRISVTQKYDVIDAKRLADQGKSGQEICDILTENKLNVPPYIVEEDIKLSPALHIFNIEHKTKHEKNTIRQQIYDIQSQINNIDEIEFDMCIILKTDVHNYLISRENWFNEFIYLNVDTDFNDVYKISDDKNIWNFENNKSVQIVRTKIKL